MKASTLFPVLLIIALFVMVGITIMDTPKVSEPAIEKAATTTSLWLPPNEQSIPVGEQGDLISYGKELIAHTSKYLGPKGSVAQLTNGMNCNNCHLDAGTKPWGNNYASVYSTYPKFRERSASMETISKRVNDCFERSLNGKPLDTNSREMLAISAYIKWLGTGIEKGNKPEGSGILELAYLDRAADPKLGKNVYENKCQSCHQANGEGLLNAEKTEYAFPPLWGNHSYNQGAGLFRLSRFAGYVKTNMPLGASHNNTILTDEESWDVAAFVNSQPRPAKDLSKDWPNIAGKPVDHPFGPFADGFSAKQHKYGPFKPIKAKREQMKKSTT